MSALGHKRTCAMQKSMSALPPIATSIAFFGMSASGQKRTSPRSTSPNNETANFLGDEENDGGAVAHHSGVDDCRSVLFLDLFHLSLAITEVLRINIWHFRACAEKESRRARWRGP